MRNLSKLLVFFSVLLVAEARSGEIHLPRLAEVKLAAERGDSKAQYELGVSFDSRLDIANAVKWYRLSAKQGSANAQCSLAQTLLREYPKMSGSAAIKAEPEEAVQWFLKAANRGHERAQIDLGHCYRDGNGVRQDYVQAYKWYSIASRQNRLWTTMYLDPLILKMSSQQIGEGQRQANAFVPHRTTPDEIPEPGFLNQLKLKGISGSKTNRVALINNRTFAVGDLVKIKLAERMIAVRCLEIRDESVIVSVGGLTKWKEIRLGNQP